MYLILNEIFYNPFYIHTFCVYVSNPRTLNFIKKLSMFIHFISIPWALSKMKNLKCKNKFV